MPAISAFKVTGEKMKKSDYYHYVNDKGDVKSVDSVKPEWNKIFIATLDF